MPPAVRSLLCKRKNQEIRPKSLRKTVELITIVTSIDPLAPYKVSDDLMLELANVTATVEDDSEEASVGAVGSDCRGSRLVKHQPAGG